jgi:hypothetical protein
MEERIKKDEPASTRRPNRIIGLIKEMWPAYLIEIIVIILGISITLALEEWRDHSKERHLEQIYLKNLLTDIQLDLQSLKYTTASTQNLLDHGNEILTYLKDPVNKPLSASQLNTDIRTILARPDFVSNDATFSDLKSSGNLQLLRDIQLKNELFAYYNQAQNIKDIQNAEQQATITLSGSYFLKQFPLADVGPEQQSAADAPKSIEFSNNVLLRVTTRQELLDLYVRADSLATRIKNELPPST